MLASINKTTKNLAYQLLQLDQDAAAGFGNLDNEPTIHDITYQFPRWIRERVSSSSTESFMITFTQAYYDWLYSPRGYGITEYEMGKISFLSILDIDTTPSEYLCHFTASYADGFPASLFELDADDNTTLSQNIEYVREFVKGVRDNFYQLKGTEKSYEYFFRTLYGVEQFPESWIEYPKKYVLRLNGGKPYGFDIPVGLPIQQTWEVGFGWSTLPAGSTTGSGIDYDVLGHLAYSVLNVHVFQDSNWYQDYSYLIKTEEENTQDRKTTDESGNPIYIETLDNLLHPAGLKAFYEVTLDDYVAPDDYEEENNLCEEPVLGNYYPYKMGSIMTIDVCKGCSGSDYRYTELGYDGGLTPGGTGATFDMPTFVFPEWSLGISCGVESNSNDPFCAGQSVFGNIYIGDFIFLCGNLADSPNLGLTGCTAYGEPTACWP